MCVFEQAAVECGVLCEESQSASQPVKRCVELYRGVEVLLGHTQHSVKHMA